MPAASLSSTPVQYTAGIRQTDVSFVSKFRGQYRYTYTVLHARTYNIHDHRSKIGRDRKNVLRIQIGFGPYLIIYFISIRSVRVWFYLRRQPRTMSNRVEIVYYAMTIQSAE